MSTDGRGRRDGWVDAYAQRDMELAAFDRRRFRAEFAPAVTAWIATRPLKNTPAPLTPFAMPQYHLAALIAASQGREAATAAEPLTDSEMRVLRLLPTPLTLRGVGDRLYLSHNTVKSHTRVLYRKLDATSREEAVAQAQRYGLI